MHPSTPSIVDLDENNLLGDIFEASHEVKILLGLSLGSYHLLDTVARSLESVTENITRC